MECKGAARVCLTHNPAQGCGSERDHSINCASGFTQLRLSGPEALLRSDWPKHETNRDQDTRALEKIVVLEETIIMDKTS